MSSARPVRIRSTENPRFPEEGSSTQGKSGPKPRTKVVGDGQQVKDSCTTDDRFKRCGDTGGQTEHAVGRACPSVKGGEIGKSVSSILRRDGVTV